MLGLVARVDRPLDPASRAPRDGDATASRTPLPMGLFVDATIAGRRADGVYVLPRAALREGPDRNAMAAPDPQADPARTPDGIRQAPSLERQTGWVLVATPEDGDGATDRLRFRRVEILRLHGEEAVVSAGLAPGEQVAISPIDTPVDGMAVRVTTVPSPVGTAGAPGRDAMAEGGEVAE